MLVSELAVRALASWEPWSDFREAREIQERLAERVVIQPFQRPYRYVLAADCAFQKNPDRIVAGAVIWDAKERNVIYRSVVNESLSVPYVPGFLSFRETPAVLKALAAIEHRADLMIVDGQGTAHPRRFGLACHLGVLLDMPVVGVGKSKLYGVHRALPPMRGAWVPLWDPKSGTILGTVVRTRAALRVP